MIFKGGDNMPHVEPMISISQLIVGWFILLLIVAWVVEVIVDKQKEKAHQDQLRQQLKLDEQTNTRINYNRKVG